jgi:hypothetical protein
MPDTMDMPLRRRLGAVAVAVAAVLAGLLTGCATNNGVVAHGSAPTAIPWTGPVYLLDYEGRPREEPDLLDLTAKSTFGGLVWKHWGGSLAIGTGAGLDLACVNGCKGDGPDSYRATVVLSGLVRRENAAYYSHASVSFPDPLPYWAEHIQRLALRVPDH